MRRNLEPIAVGPTAAPDSAVAALAVHYFPGMWAWNRDIVAPLVLQAAGDAAEFVQKYVAWAEQIDDFEPLRVEFDFDARVPRLDRTGDLAAPDGRAVHYQGRVHALVVDDDRGQWLLVHRFGPWTDAEVLRLDEAAPSAAWAWEQTFLDAQIQGVLYNELTLDAQFRRTRIRFTRDAVAHAGEQLAAEAAAMVANDVALYPTPSNYCAACPFLWPCIAMQDGNGGEDLLAQSYQTRPPEELIEGRLGGSTWSMGRGARPARFSD